MTPASSLPSIVAAGGPNEPTSDIYQRLLKERIVFIGSAIDQLTANLVCAQLILLEAEDPEKDISLYINSPGGSVTDGLAIYDTMQFVRPDVATICMGQASSAAAVLLAAGAPGKRAVLPHAKVLLHQPSSQARGTLPDLAIQAKEVVRVRAEVDEILSQHTGHPVSKIRSDTDRNKTFSAVEAVEYGLADEVISSRKGTAAVAALVRA